MFVTSDSQRLQSLRDFLRTVGARHFFDLRQETFGSSQSFPGAQILSCQSIRIAYLLEDGLVAAALQTAKWACTCLSTLSMVGYMVTC